MSHSDDIKRSKEKVAKSTNLTGILNELNQAQSGVEKRQELIRKIQEYLKEKDDKERKLILYVSNFGRPNSDMNPGDAVPLSNLLSSMEKVKNLDLMLHSPGGDGNIAEKIIQMCRQYCSDKGEFRVIVPNMAKSAATLVTFGSDKIWL